MKSTIDKKRILIAGFQHETNTFGATKAGFDDFVMADSWPGLLMGDDILSGTEGTTLPLAGFVAAARQNPLIDLIPIIWCAAEPSAHVTDHAYEKIAAIICDGIAKTPDLDGIYLDLHGAMVTESFDDGEGELLRRIRALVGPDLPISISLDSHANVTPQMIIHASSMTLFRSYPHLDMDETGGRAFDALMPLIAGQKRHLAWRQSPYLIPLPDQFSGAEPMISLYQALKGFDQAPDRWCEFATGFPAADIHDAGPSIIAQAPSKAEAEDMAEAMFQSLLSAERYFKPTLFSPDEAVARALSTHAATNQPVVIADVEDNAGAGSPSDTTGLLHALIKAGAENVLLGMLNDPDVARLAHDHGVGGSFETALGGKAMNGDLHDHVHDHVLDHFLGDPPLFHRFDVIALSDGHFAFTGEMYRGFHADAGLSAVIKPQGHDIRIVISSKRCQCLDQAIFTHLGQDPRGASLLVVKSTVHYRADFDPIAPHVINAAANGLTPCRLPDAGFTRLRHGVRLGANGPIFSL